MKRSNLKRSASLKADPAKTREFNQRGRGKLKRTNGLWDTARNPVPRRVDKRLPGATGWTQRVFALYGRKCIVCSARAIQGHHIVPRQAILAARHLTPEQRTALVYDARNGAPVCLRCHERHETAAARIAFACLPAAAVAWAVQWGFRGRVMDSRVYPREEA